MNTTVVHRAFECKITKTMFYPGDIYGSDDLERIKFLQREGYLADTLLPITKRILCLTGSVAGEQKNDVVVPKKIRLSKSGKKVR